MTENATFRLQCKTVHLTYKTHLEFQELLEWVQGKFGRVEYYSMVHEEGHAEEETPYAHTHALFSFQKKLNTRDQRCFDHKGIHPNIKVVKDQKHAKEVWFYHEKEPVKLLRSEYHPFSSPEDLMERIKRAKTLVEACNLAGVKPQTVSDIRILRTERSVQQDIPELLDAGEWTWMPSQLNWRTLYLYGTSGIGKTRWALSQGTKPLLVSHLEDLKQYMPDHHDLIVFDDMNFRAMDPSVAIHLLDWDLPRTLNVKYGSITIPARTRKVICSNIGFWDNFQCDNEDQRSAILRRVHIEEVRERMWIPTEPATNAIVATASTSATVPTVDLTQSDQENSFDQYMYRND